MEEGITKAVKIMEIKYAALEKRTEILESELFEKSHKVDALQAIIAQRDTAMQTLNEQLESMDVNRRMNTVILKCEDFGQRIRDENIEVRTADVLNRRFPDMKITVGDFQTVHRLQNDKSVICKFVHTRVRDELYERRFDLSREKRGTRERQAPLYINESLTAKNMQIFNALLDAKRSGWVYTVYTRRGLVNFKASRDSRGRRVDSIHQLKAIIETAKSDAAAASAGRPPRLGAPMAGAAPRQSGAARPERRPVPVNAAVPAPPAVGGRSVPLTAAAAGGGERPASATPPAGPEPAAVSRLDAPMAGLGAVRSPPGSPAAQGHAVTPGQTDRSGPPPDVPPTDQSDPAVAAAASGRDVWTATSRQTDCLVPAAGKPTDRPVQSAVGARLNQYAYCP